MPLRHRRHRWIALLALFGLLFQQLAMASYVCPQERGAQATLETTAKVPPCHVDVATDKARCQQHCFPQPPSHDLPPMPTVPAMLPATTWLHEPGDRSLGRDGACGASPLAAWPTAPPLTIQYCTFQI